jgi:hypothetical protein
LRWGLVRCTKSMTQSEDNLQGGEASRSASSHSALPYTVVSIDLLKRRTRSRITSPNTRIPLITPSTIAALVLLFASLGLGDALAVVEVADVAAAVEVADSTAVGGLSTVEEVLIAIKPGLEKKINTSVRQDEPKCALCRND